MTPRTNDPRANFAAVLHLISSIQAACGQQYRPPRPYVLLYALGACGDAPTVSDLARAAGVDLKTASRVLKIFVRRGWLELVLHEQDTRKRRARLTPDGERVLRAINKALVDTAVRVAANAGNAPRWTHLKKINLGPYRATVSYLRAA